MAVKVTQWSKNGKGGFEVDIRITLPDGSRVRERVKSPVTSRSGSLRWGQQREAEIFKQGGRTAKKKAQAPTMETFWPRFMEGHAKANRQKASYVAERGSIYRNHFAGDLAAMPLDQITDGVVQGLKARLAGRSPKTVNNVLVCLSTVLKVAVEWGVLDRMPCRIRLLKVAKATVSFYEPEEYERLVQAAEVEGPAAHLAVLLGGDAGLRLGEILALQWADVDFSRGQIHVQRADWRGTIGLPKSGKPRIVPMTGRLSGALGAHRGIGQGRVVALDGGPLDRDRLKRLMAEVQTRAEVEAKGGVHILRHTYGAALAMAGAPAKQIQEVMGHANLSTTERYMHLTPQATRDGIRLLERFRGDVGETKKAPTLE